MADSSTCPRCGSSTSFSDGPIQPRMSGDKAVDTRFPTIVTLPPAEDGSEASRSTVYDPESSEVPPPIERGDRYELFGEIARGGMGAVLKGRDPELGRELAIKVILDRHKDKPDLMRRFVEEAQIGGQLQHPGIVPIHELGVFEDRRPYFTMKLITGRNLSELLRERGDPSEDLPRFLGIFEQIAQTVAYAHARGVIHRDLKPMNVMTGAFGEVHVMDWGLAKVLREGTDPGALKAAPEGESPPTSNVRTLRSESDGDSSKAGSALGTPAS